MSDVTVPRESTLKLSRVEGNLRVGDRGRVEQEGPDPINVSVEVMCQGDADFQGSLHCGRFNGENGRIQVSGDLTCETEVEVKRSSELRIGGTLEARSVEVDSRLSVGKSAKADEFDIGGMLEIGESITDRTVEVGGSFRVQGSTEVDDVDVGGRVELEGPVKIVRLEVGGSARVGGGEISKQVDVGGSFVSAKPLKFGDIDVGGTVTLDQGGEGRGIDVGGRFESRGNLNFETIDVGGTVEITGNGEGEAVDVGGHLEVSGDLTLRRDLDIGGKAKVGGNLKLQSLEVGGVIEASFIEAQDKVEVGGRLATTKGTKARTIELGSRSEATGVLIGTQVRIRDRARVDDVYADVATLEEGVRARNLYMRAGRIESHCKISGEVLYQETIEADPEAEFSKPPVKTAELPRPPI